MDEPTTFPWFCEEFQRDLGREEYAIYMNRPVILEDGRQIPYDRQTYIDFWSSEMTQDPEDKLRLTHACKHLGKVVGELDCTCPAAKRPTEIRECSLHGRCAMMGVVDEGVRNCRNRKSCGDYCPSNRKLKMNHQRNSYDVLDEDERCRLTIGCAVAEGEEYSAVWATFNAINLYHRDVLDEYNAEFLVVDCGHKTVTGQTISRWITSKFRRARQPFGRYIAWDGPAGTAQPRQAIFDNARGDLVIVCDPHVFFDPGALKAVTDYCMSHVSDDMIVGPQVDDNGAVSAYQRPEWASGSLGIWTGDERANSPTNPPFPVFQQGLGAFACRRESFVGFHPDFREFGGCESYVCEKTRMAGGEVVCHPGFRWRHRFQNPSGVRDSRTSRQQFINYITGFLQLGKTEWIEQCLEHYTSPHPKSGVALLNEADAQSILAETLTKYGAQTTPQDSLSLVIPESLMASASSENQDLGLSEYGVRFSANDTAT